MAIIILVAAHSNTARDGKGTWEKSDDCFVAFLCFICHRNYDQKIRNDWNDHNGKPQKRYLFTQSDFDNAMKRTWKLLLMNGVIK